MGEVVNFFAEFIAIMCISDAIILGYFNQEPYSEIVLGIGFICLLFSKSKVEEKKNE